jgi:hypothetical protein
MSLSGDTIWFDVVEIAKTDKAYLFEFDGIDEQLWIPKSQCGGRRKDEDGEVVRVELSKWIAKEKGLV